MIVIPTHALEEELASIKSAEQFVNVMKDTKEAIVQFKVNFLK